VFWRSGGGELSARAEHQERRRHRLAAFGRRLLRRDDRRSQALALKTPRPATPMAPRAA